MLALRRTQLHSSRILSFSQLGLTILVPRLLVVVSAHCTLLAPTSSSYTRKPLEALHHHSPSIYDPCILYETDGYWSDATIRNSYPSSPSYVSFVSSLSVAVFILSRIVRPWRMIPPFSTHHASRATPLPSSPCLGSHVAGPRTEYSCSVPVTLADFTSDELMGSRLLFLCFSANRICTSFDLGSTRSLLLRTFNSLPPSLALYLWSTRAVGG